MQHSASIAWQEKWTVLKLRMQLFLFTAIWKGIFLNEHWRVGTSAGFGKSSLHYPKISDLLSFNGNVFVTSCDVACFLALRADDRLVAWLQLSNGSRKKERGKAQRSRKTSVFVTENTILHVSGQVDQDRYFSLSVINRKSRWNSELLWCQNHLKEK